MLSAALFSLALALDQPDTAGYLFAHIDTDVFGESWEAFQEFYGGVDPAFVLRARGHDDVPARAIHKVWLDSDKDLKEFILRIDPPDFVRMASGVDYELAWAGKGDGLRWSVKAGVEIARPKR